MLHQESNAAAIIRTRKVPSQRRRDGLIRFACDRTSQNGEDGIIDRIFQLIPVTDCSSTTERRRLCVDVGAWDGVHLSNTHSLLDNNIFPYWRGILIEADPEKFQQLSNLYDGADNVLLNVNISVMDPDRNPNSLHHILEKQLPIAMETGAHFDIDFLCIDIDGSDYFVLNDMFLFTQHRPIVICIEFNPTIPDDLIYIPPRSDSVRHGASLAALVELSSKYDYVLVETTLYNAFFVRKREFELFLSLEVKDTSIEALHETTMGTSMYQLYDGTLKLWGCKRMLWHRIPLDENKIQMIPKDHRTFPFAPSVTTNMTEFDMSGVVNMSPYCKSLGTEDDQKKCASFLYSQLKKDGFCLIHGTGIDQRICQNALNACNNFLQNANEDVRRSCLAVDRARRGYSPMNVENFASLIGEKAPNDLVRKFRIGPLHPSSNVATDETTLLQPNVWPSAEIWNNAISFKMAVEEYYEAACSSVQGVVRAICDGLMLEYPELLSALHPLMHIPNAPSNQTTSILTLLGYRAGTRHKGKTKGPLVAAHTDVGVITMLLFDGCDTCATLQRSDGNGGWTNVDLPQTGPTDPVFVVNVADLLSDLCRNLLPSTLHRVVARPASTSPRNCCALFVGLDSTTQLSIGNEVLSYEEWRKRRIAKAQSIT